jgi:excisionase family DNA binding protein
MLTVSEVSAALRVSHGTVYALIRADVLAAVRIRHQYRVAEKVLANFIEAGGGGWRKPAPETDHAA